MIIKSTGVVCASSSVTKTCIRMSRYRGWIERVDMVCEPAASPYHLHEDQFESRGTHVHEDGLSLRHDHRVSLPGGLVVEPRGEVRPSVEVGEVGGGGVVDQG